ncbi:hypothetical protein [Ktedonospora formicarum]|uniref:Uncharacterized protein n=1 Tax=Ktedonospora formicarum TaxID=2778364 RepID=A0A8J3MZL2_9CHLR|nr:hypothetical protein [Ktedonospora formicarum]GHO50900.1 hypothetical protein KSX_90630 [Ktedonospora formicarum]
MVVTPMRVRVGGMTTARPQQEKVLLTTDTPEAKDGDVFPYRVGMRFSQKIPVAMVHATAMAALSQIFALSTRVVLSFCQRRCRRKMIMVTFNTTHVYSLPLAILVDILSARCTSLVLRTTLHVHVPQARLAGTQDALVEILLEHGMVCDCQVRSRATGQRLMEHDVALTFLYGVGVLEWQVTPCSSLFGDHAPLVPTSEVRQVPSEVVPISSLSLHDVHLASLPVRVRQVLLLANGERSLRDIASLLSLSTEEASRLLRMLSERQLLCWQGSTS